MVKIIARETFFSRVRPAPFGNRLTTEQVQGMNEMLDEWEEKYHDKDIRWLAYIFASVFRETGGRMVPVRETFAHSDAQAISRLNTARMR